jgi:hypothetical protein
MAQRTRWDGDYLDRELDLTGFRGDNAFLWQFRNLGAEARLKYYFYLRDLAGLRLLGLRVPGLAAGQPRPARLGQRAVLPAAPPRLP